MESRHFDIEPFERSEIVKRVSEGDERAFSELMRIYGDTVFSQALAFVKSVPQAEELTQDIFLRVWRNREKLSGVENFENWLFIVARNLIFDSFNRKVKQPVAELAFLPEVQTPDLQTEYRESYQIFLRGIELLPEKRKAVFKMSRLEGMSHEQIAQVLGIHKITVAQYIVKSLSFLKTYLAKYGDDTICLLFLAIVWLPN